MKDQRLVNTILTGGAEDYELPRVQNILLSKPKIKKNNMKK